MIKLTSKMAEVKAFNPFANFFWLVLKIGTCPQINFPLKDKILYENQTRHKQNKTELYSNIFLIISILTIQLEEICALFE